MNAGLEFARRSTWFEELKQPQHAKLSELIWRRQNRFGGDTNLRRKTIATTSRGRHIVQPIIGRAQASFVVAPE